MKSKFMKRGSLFFNTMMLAMGFFFYHAKTTVVHAYEYMETVTVTVDISDYRFNHVGAENGERFPSSDGKVTFILYTNTDGPNGALRVDIEGEWYEGYLPDLSKSGGYYTQVGVTSEGWYDLQVNVINSGSGTPPTPPTPPVVEQPEPVEQPKPEPQPETKPEPESKPEPAEQSPAIETPAVEEVVVVEEVPTSTEPTGTEEHENDEENEKEQDEIKDEEKKEETHKKVLKGTTAIITASDSLESDKVATETTETKESEEPDEKEETEVETEVLSEREEAGFPWWIFLILLAGGAAVVVYRKHSKQNK